MGAKEVDDLVNKHKVEMSALRWEDVGFKGGFLDIEKARKIKLTDEALEILRQRVILIVFRSKTVYNERKAG